MEVKYPEIKKTREKFLSLCLNVVEQWSRGDLKRTDVAKRLGAYSSWSAPNQALTYHLNRLMKEGLIHKIQSYPYAIYGLTSKGLRIKEILIQSQPVRSLWRCHHLIVAFPVKSFGNFNFVNTTRRKIIQMNNWTYAREKIGETVVNIQDTGLLKIFCPPRYSPDPDIAFGKMYSEATRIAQHYVDSYGMDLRPMRIIRKGHKALVKSETLAKTLGKFSINNKVWVDESDGMELEERQDSYAVEDLMKLPQQFRTFTANIDSYNRNIELHMEVMQNIQTGIKELSAGVSLLVKTVGRLEK